MPYFETKDGLRLAYKDWGSGPPAVFVSSWALSSKMWEYQMIEIAERGLRAVAYDRRGHGRSEHATAGYDYDSLADDLATLLDVLDIEGATLISHSMGEGEIVRYISRHGSSRVAKIILVSPLGPFPLLAPDNPEGLDPAIVEAVRETWKQDFPGWLEATQDAYVGRGLPGCEVSTGLVDWTKRDMLDTSLLALLECSRSGVCTDRRPDMAKIDVPTLIIHGDHDASAPVDLSGRICAELIEGSVFTLYENAPHGMYMSHRERLTDDIFDFATG